MTDFLVEVAPIVDSLVFTVLGFIATILGIKGKQIMNSIESNERVKKIKADLELNKEIVEISVDYAEQFGEHLAGTEKFRLAREKAHSLFSSMGIYVSDTEAEALIEQVVHGYNKGRKKELENKG